MQIKNEHHTFTGMQRDMGASKQPSSFLYNGYNIRLTPRGDNTMYAITNERGTLDTNIRLLGTYMGHCLLNNYLVVFTTSATDYIYRIDLVQGTSTLLYSGSLNFDLQHPIEAIGSYENEHIQKVYWTDNLNQPRVINIVGDIKTDVDSQFDFIRELSLRENVTINKQIGTSGSFHSGVIQYALTYFDKFMQESNIFYTSPLLYIAPAGRGASPEETVNNSFKITVNNIDSNFNYLRIYSIQRTSLNGTPIVKRVQDIAIHDVHDVYNSPVTSPNYERPKENNVYVPDDQFSESSFLDTLISPDLIGYHYFKKSDYPNLVISVPDGELTWGPDTTEDSYIGISLSTVTINGSNVYVVFQVDSLGQGSTLQSMNMNKNSISFTDTGTVGDSIDPTELLYKGGETIKVATLEQKDNTLFFGNIQLSRPTLSDYELSIRESLKPTMTSSTRRFELTGNGTTAYVYTNQLEANCPCGGFKRGDYYRFGVQFQYKTGNWSEPIWIDDFKIESTPSYNTSNNSDVTVPSALCTIHSELGNTLLGLGYKRVRPVVVFPELQDRAVLCQGIATPTVKRSVDDSYLSSWFFRPKKGSSVADSSGGKYIPINEIAYTRNSVGQAAAGSQVAIVGYDPTHIRSVEIQGEFDDNSQFGCSAGLSSFHSPDIEFGTELNINNVTGLKTLLVGKALFSYTASDIDIQTESPTIGAGSGFIHKSFSSAGAYGIISGLFYEDFIVEDKNNTEFRALVDEKSPVKWLIYPWQRNGSLNNDINRPTGSGTRTALLKKKVISNLRYTYTAYKDKDNLGSPATVSGIGTFNSDEVSIIKIGDVLYQGNVDTVLNPTGKEGLYFAFDGVVNTNPDITVKDIDTSFTSNKWWKTYNKSYSDSDGQGIWAYEGGDINKWTHKSGIVGNEFLDLAINKDLVRMKYKSTPHFVIVSSISYDADGHEVCLPVVDLLVDGGAYRNTMFGGKTPDALKANTWVPCGDSTLIVDGGDTQVRFIYGDTYFQRWDCLKTYPFTLEDQNQVIEIGSFMLETRVNIDGRYDKNRGQINNLNMTPNNFNLLNPVYSQVDNFFSYRILDKSYYGLNAFPNQITWSKEKKAGADTDTWTNVTLASTYDMDGSKGAIRSLNTWKDNIFCFQDKGVSTILFNSRVQIPTSDGVPIEISNSYKVDGYRYISDGVGCVKPKLIIETPAGIYFIDSVQNHLYSIGDGIADVTATHSMSSWFDNYGSTLKKLLYDNVNHDLYLVSDSTALCFSELLGQFTSFFDYEGTLLIETCNSHVFTMKGDRLFKLFEGEYNYFFNKRSNWSFTFISNGGDDNLIDFDKIFSNIDCRMDVMDSSGVYQHDKFLDTIQVETEYQGTGEVSLIRHAGAVLYPNNKNLEKKFRIWRIQIPRNHNSLDRIRNTWCKITLGGGNDNYKTVLHDLNVQYYI